jgi:hypothetical protein
MLGCALARAAKTGSGGYVRRSDMRFSISADGVGSVVTQVHPQHVSLAGGAILAAGTGGGVDTESTPSGPTPSAIGINAIG